MYFETIQDVWAMAGHGPYVWSAYVITVLTLAGLLWAPMRNQSSLKRDLRAHYRRQGFANGPAAESED